jgi:hypothetical protein
MVQIVYMGNGHMVRLVSPDGQHMVESFEGQYGYDTQTFTLKEETGVANGDLDDIRKFVRDYSGADGSWTTLRGVEEAIRSIGIRGVRVRRAPGAARRPYFDLGD